METFETPQSVEQKPANWPKIILAAVLGLGLLAGSAYAGYWYGTESAKSKSQISKPTPVVSKPTATPAPSVEDIITDWNTYVNEEYGFEFKYPKDWRIASSIMEWYKEEATNPRYTPLVEDWVMVTNLSVEEEAIYLSALESYQGIGSGISHIENADGRAVEVQPTTNTIKELKENKVPGWDFSNFREIKTNSGLTITQFRETVTWEMDRDFEVAYVPYPGDKMLRDDKITYLSLWIERNDGNYEDEVFDQILSTFKFLG